METTKRFYGTLIIVGILRFISGKTQPCPSPNQHCICSNINVGAVTCSDISRVPEKLPNATNILDLEGNFLGPVLIKEQVDQLGSLNLLELYLTRNKLEIIEDEAFSMLYRLLTLDLSENNLQGLGDNTLVGLKSLKYLYGNNMNLMAIPHRMFENVPKLVHLELEGNKLTTIGREFDSLMKLQTLLLANNRITEISRESFASLSALMHLSLFGNGLNVPRATWFSTVASNNGTVEVDRRSGSSAVLPNPWICCPGVSLYYYYLTSISSKLRSYNQLNVACSWPVALSGRLMNTLNENELNAVMCADYTKPTTPFVFTLSSGNLTPVTTPTSFVIVGNFMGGLSDVGAVFILLFIAVLSGALVAAGFYFYKNDKGKQKLGKLFSRSDDSNQSKNDKSKEVITTRPFRQSACSSIAEVAGRPLSQVEKPRRPAPPPPPSKSPEAAYASVVQPAEQTYSNYTMDTDQSEEEAWSESSRKSPA